MKKPKVIVVLPAYNAEKTFEKTILKIPKDSYDDLILVDDASSDKTYEKALKMGIKAYQNKINLGYGGNLKVCLLKALEEGADIIIEMHPDYEYNPAAIPPALKKVGEGAHLVVGNRFTTLLSALSMGMLLPKYITSRMLSIFHRFVFRIDLTDWHQGFRVYTKSLLENINFTANSNNYLFSFEVIVQAIFLKKNIAQVPVSCEYKGKKRGASYKNSFKYVSGTFAVLMYFFFAKLGLKNKLFSKRIKNLNCRLCKEKGYVYEKYKSNDFISGESFFIFSCAFCQNAFINPLPNDLGKYYPLTYYGNKKLIGFIKGRLYLIFQKRRIKAILSYKKIGRILDVGSGEGNIGRSLEAKGFFYQGIDATFSRINNTKILKKDFLSYNPEKKYDVITFWESLEHFPNPASYINKAAKILNRDGIIVIEAPRFNSLESKFFAGRWYHLSPPRHTSYFTDNGLKFLLKNERFEITEQKSILALDYSLFGFIQSTLNFFQKQDKLTARLTRNENIKVLFSIDMFTALFFVPLSLVVEIFLYFINSSPIVLSIARKEK